MTRYRKWRDWPEALLLLLLLLTLILAHLLR